MSAPAQKNLSPAPVSIRTWTDSSMRASRMCESSHQDYQYFFQNGQDQTTKTIRFPSFSSELREMFPKPSQMRRSNARLPTDWFAAALSDAQGLPRKSTNTHTPPLSNVDSSPEPPKHGYGTG